MSVWQRDFVGYGSMPPKVEWPNGKKLALQIAVNYEAAGERDVLSGDRGQEVMGGEIPSYESLTRRDLSMETVFEYESRVAIWRIFDLLDKHKVKTTFFAVAKSLEATPEAGKAIIERGHEICSHGYRWIEHFRLTSKQEAEEISKAIALIKKITGERSFG